MKLRVTFEISREMRQVVTDYYGLDHLATRADVIRFIEACVYPRFEE